MFGWEQLRMPAIVISHFLLDLRYINTHPTGTTGRSSFLPSFQVTTYQIQSAILQDFGDPMLTKSGNGEMELEDQGLGGHINHQGEEISASNLDPEFGPTSNGLGIREASSMPVGGNNKAEVGMDSTQWYSLCSWIVGTSFHLVVIVNAH
jgi:hypothetical protein